VIDAHFAEYPPYGVAFLDGVAFLALAGFQVVWAVAYVLSPERPLAVAAIVVNAGAVLIWAASRTVGLPFGPEPGHVDSVGPFDVAAGAMEITLIAALAWSSEPSAGGCDRRSLARERRPWQHRAPSLSSS
jgi:hypothetical protein